MHPKGKTNYHGNQNAKKPKSEKITGPSIKVTNCPNRGLYKKAASKEGLTLAAWMRKAADQAITDS